LFSELEPLSQLSQCRFSLLFSKHRSVYPVSIVPIGINVVATTEAMVG
jgi:hypothetical protein